MSGPQIWSWVLSILGLVTIYLAGKKYWWAWLFGLCAQVLWLTYGLVYHQYGFIVSSAAYGYIYGRNTLKWFQEKKSAQLKVSRAGHPSMRQGK